VKDVKKISYRSEISLLLLKTLLKFLFITFFDLFQLNIITAFVVNYTP